MVRPPGRAPIVIVLPSSLASPNAELQGALLAGPTGAVAQALTGSS